MKINNLINKRAQIGVTLTWMTATVIIFFIMLLFLTSTIILSAKQKLTFNQDKTNIKEFEYGDYDLQKKLTGFLVSYVNNQRTVDYLSTAFEENTINQKFIDYFGEDECYLLCIFGEVSEKNIMGSCPGISSFRVVDSICIQVKNNNRGFFGFNYAQYDNGNTRIALLKEIKNE